MSNLINNIHYFFFRIQFNIREARLKLRGYDRIFHCKKEENGELKCKTQCNQCFEYSQNLEVK